MSAPKPTDLDAYQVLKGAFDEESGRLRTDSVINIDSAQVTVELDASTDGVHIADKTTGSRLSVNQDGSINAKVTQPRFPDIANILLTDSAEEYYYTLPNNTKKLEIKPRKGSLRLSFIAEGTSTEYITIPMGCTYTVENINYNGNLFLRSNKDNDVVEIMSWY